MSSKPRKKLILAIIIPLIIIAGLCTWYFAYLTNPYVVTRAALADWIANRDNSGSYDLTIKDQSDNHTNVRASIKGSFSYLASGRQSGDISFITSDDKRSLDLGKLSFVNSSEALIFKWEPSSSLKQSVAGLDNIGNQWAKIDMTKSSADLSTDSTDTASTTGAANADSGQQTQQQVKSGQRCLQIGTDELDSRSNQEQLINALLDTNFLTITSGNSDQAGHSYNIKLDSNHYGDFIRRFVDTNYAQAIINCSNKGQPTDKNNSLTSDESIKAVVSKLNQINPSVTIWIKGLFNRQLSKINVSANIGSAGKTNINADISFANKAPTINTPESQPIEQVMQDNQQAISNLTGLFLVQLLSSNSSQLNFSGANQSTTASEVTSN